MNHRKLRWGILGTAEIARKNWRAIALAGNSTVVAVASRDLEKSRRFIAVCQQEEPMAALPIALGSYEALIESPDVDAVYLPLPTGIRKEWVIRAAESGKHVVCEKPCAVSLDDLKVILEACRRNREQFLDGVMFLHSRRLDAIRQVLDDGRSVGAIRRIDCAFSFPGTPEFFAGNIRVNGALEPDGCLGDLGWYCIRFALWVMKWQLPRHVCGRLLARTEHAGGGSVPTEFSGELLFDGGVSSGFSCSFVAGLQQWAVVSGVNGYLRVPDFVLPFYGAELSFEVNTADYKVLGCDFHMIPGRRTVSVSEHSNGHPDAQETNLFRAFAEQVQSGRLNNEWTEIALQTQVVMEGLRQSAQHGGAAVPVRR